MVKNGKLAEARCSTASEQSHHSTLEQMTKNHERLIKEHEMLNKQVSKLAKTKDTQSTEIADLKNQIDSLYRSIRPASPNRTASLLHTDKAPTIRPQSSSTPLALTQVSEADRSTPPNSPIGDGSSGTETEKVSANPIFRQLPQDDVPFTVRLPAKAKITGLLIGDSNLQRVDRRRLDPSGATCVRTLRGVKVGQLAVTLNHCEPRTDVGRMVVHVGTNDCASDHDIEVILRDYHSLTVAVRRAFPSASIAFTSVLPQGLCPLQKVRTVNERLAKLCRQEKVHFLHEAGFYTPTGTVVTSLFSSDRMHVNDRGAGVLLRLIKQFLLRQAKDHRESETQQHRNQRATRQVLSTCTSDKHYAVSDRTQVGNPSECQRPDRISQFSVGNVRQPSQTISARRWETVHNNLFSASNDSNISSDIGPSAPAAVNIQSCGEQSAPPVNELTGANEGGSRAAFASGFAVSQPPFYHRADAGPDTFASCFPGNYVRPSAGFWPQVTPHGLHVPPFPAFHPAFSPYPVSYPQWPLPYHTGGLRPQVIM